MITREARFRGYLVTGKYAKCEAGDQPLHARHSSWAPISANERIGCRTTIRTHYTFGPQLAAVSQHHAHRSFVLQGVLHNRS